MECDAGAPVCSVEERVSAVAGGNVLGQTGGEPGGAGYFRVLLDIEVGAAGVSVLGGEGAEGGTAEAVKGQQAAKGQDGSEELSKERVGDNSGAIGFWVKNSDISNRWQRDQR